MPQRAARTVENQCSGCIIHPRCPRVATLILSIVFAFSNVGVIIPPNWLPASERSPIRHWKNDVPAPVPIFGGSCPGGTFRARGAVVPREPAKSFQRNQAT